MKKIFTLMTILFLAFSLSGCDLLTNMMSWSEQNEDKLSGGLIDNTYRGTWSSGFGYNQITVEISGDRVRWGSGYGSLSNQTYGFTKETSATYGPGGYSGKVYTNNDYTVHLYMRAGGLLNISVQYRISGTNPVNGTFERRDINTGPVMGDGY